MGLMGMDGAEVKGDGLMGRAWAGLGAAGRAVLDQLYPPGCAACGAPLMDGDGLCAACFVQLRHIRQPLCPVLGIPFESDLGADTVSAEALADPPPFARARAAVSYGEVAGTLVSRLKYGDRPELARFCARLMASAGAEFWDASPVLLPVPLHASRLRFRRYNQSLLLAREIGRLANLAVDPHLAHRRKRTRQQVGLSGDSRLRNVQGAFAAHPRFVERLAGRPIVLIDDVYTTGATVKAVTRVLKRAGAEEVNVLTFARVVIGEEMPI
jgi:ComF family protein